jgi:hypothetical protein
MKALRETLVAGNFDVVAVRKPDARNQNQTADEQWEVHSYNS